MDIARAFSYVFEDERWVSKVLLGGVIFLIPIIGQIVVIGYMLKIAQNVAQGVARPLPEWSDFGDHLGRGFYGFIIQLVYLLPAIVLYFLFIIITIIGASAAGDNSNAGGGAIGLSALCLFPLMFILGIAGSIAAYVALARYLSTGVLSEAFKFSDVFANLRANAGTWVMFIIVAFLAGIAAQVGLIACGVGVLFTLAYSQFVIGHGLGQAMRLAGFASTPVPGTFDAPPPYTPPTF